MLSDGHYERYSARLGNIHVNPQYVNQKRLFGVKVLWGVVCKPILCVRRRRRNLHRCSSRVERIAYHRWEHTKAGARAKLGSAFHLRPPVADAAQAKNHAACQCTYAPCAHLFSVIKKMLKRCYWLWRRRVNRHRGATKPATPGCSHRQQTLLSGEPPSPLKLWHPGTTFQPPLIDSSSEI